MKEYFKTIDPRCQYWILTYPKSKKSEVGRAEYIEGVIRPIVGESEKIIWEPLSILNKFIYNSKIITKSNFLELLRDEAIVRVTPDRLKESHIKIYSSKKKYKEFFTKNIYLEHEIPILIENQGGIAIYSACKDAEFYKKMKDKKD